MCPASLALLKKMNAWNDLVTELRLIAKSEPLLRTYLENGLIAKGCLAGALAQLLADKLASAALPYDALMQLFASDGGGLDERSAALDLVAAASRDPAAHGMANPFLHQKGFHALEVHRAAHKLWQAGRHTLAFCLQSRVSEVFAVDIHPAAHIGQSIFIDHATGVVIGETAVLEDEVSLLQDVTLGGTGKETGDRHPKIGRGVLICAGAKILGNVRVGEGAVIGAGSVVLKAVPPHTTVAGVPSRVIGKPRGTSPGVDMDPTVDRKGNMAAARSPRGP